MSFDDTLIFPEAISYGAAGGPAWDTQIVITGGGLEYRNQSRTQQLCTFNVGHAARHTATFAALARFYWAARGRFYGFRYKDFSDFNVADFGGTAVFVLLTTTTFQCYKRYTFGATNYDRKITKLYGTFASVGGTFASVDKNTGIVTMSAGAPTSWTSTFHVPCRFDIDEAQFQIIDKGVLGWTSIPIKEVRI